MRKKEKYYVQEAINALEWALPIVEAKNKCQPSNLPLAEDQLKCALGWLKEL